MAAQFPGKVSIFAKNLTTGAVYDLGGSNRVNTASTIKLPILIAVYTAEHEGRAHWTDTSELTKENKVAGSECCGKCRTEPASRCAIWSDT